MAVHTIDGTRRRLGVWGPDQLLGPVRGWTMRRWHEQGLQHLQKVTLLESLRHKASTVVRSSSSRTHGGAMQKDTAIDVFPVDLCSPTLSSEPVFRVDTLECWRVRGCKHNAWRALTYQELCCLGSGHL